MIQQYFHYVTTVVLCSRVERRVTVFTILVDFMARLQRFSNLVGITDRRPILDLLSLNIGMLPLVRKMVVRGESDELILSHRLISGVQ